MLDAGKLRHRITIQEADSTQDSFGDMNPTTWEDVAEVWAAIEPLSAREFVSANAEQSKIVARITIRFRDDIYPDMRINHNGKIYNIEGILADKDSGFEYLTLPVSEGVRIE